MITRVQAKNFRSIASCDVTLGDLTVLVGRNGAGKSSFVDILRFVRDSAQLGLTHSLLDRGGMPTVRYFPRRGSNLEIKLSLDLLLPQPGKAEYFFSLALGDEGYGFRVEHETCSVVLADGQEERFDRKRESLTSFNSGTEGAASSTTTASELDPADLALRFFAIGSPLLRRVTEAMNSRFCDPLPQSFRMPYASFGNRPDAANLTESGDNLAAVLKRIEASPFGLSEIVGAIQRVVDGITGIEVVPFGDFLFVKIVHGGDPGEPGFTLLQESEGTLRTLALLTAIHQRVERDSGILVIEEPELSIHPGALAVLSDEFDEASLRTQILLTTQSPDLISRFRADQLRVVERIDGETKIGRLDEAQRKTIERSLFSGGDLLRIEGLRRQVSDESLHGA